MLTGSAENRGPAGFPWLLIQGPAGSGPCSQAFHPLLHWIAGGQESRGWWQWQEQWPCHCLLSAAACSACAATAQGHIGGFWNGSPRQTDGSVLSSLLQQQKGQAPPAKEQRTTQHTAMSPVVGTQPPLRAGKPCLLHRLPVPLNNTSFHQVSGRRWSLLELKVDQDPASSQVQGLLLKTGPSRGPRLQLRVTSEAHTGGIQSTC